MPQWEINITGRVQGVGFRYHAQASARQCRIEGYVRNLPDCSVYILAHGSQDLFESFCELLKAGNGFSRVRTFSINEIDFTKEYHGFEIR